MHDKSLSVDIAECVSIFAFAVGMLDGRACGRTAAEQAQRSARQADFRIYPEAAPMFQKPDILDGQDCAYDAHFMDKCFTAGIRSCLQNELASAQAPSIGYSDPDFETHPCRITPRLPYAL